MPDWYHEYGEACAIAQFFSMCVIMTLLLERVYEMKNSITELALFLKYLPIYRQIGINKISANKLKTFIEEGFRQIPEEKLPEEYTENDLTEADCLKMLHPFVVKGTSGDYEINFKHVRDVLIKIMDIFLPKLLDESFLNELIEKYYPHKVIRKIDEVENVDHQSYKYLFENLEVKYQQLNEEFHSTRYELDQAHRDIGNLNAEVKRLRENTGNMQNSTKDIISFINDYVNKEVVVSDVRVFSSQNSEIKCSSEKRNGVRMEALSLTPGIYNHKRPSWFTPLNTELSKRNVGRKAATNAEELLIHRILFWKKQQKLLASGKKNEKIALEVDEMRRKQIFELIHSDAANEEKYLKYILLTPGMPKEFIKTLNGAEELGLNADIVIELLEQPAENFNRDMIELFVSQTHKALDYNLKLELAKELIKGEWYVSSDINGTTQKFQLVPIDSILEIKNRLEHISAVFEEYEKIMQVSVCHDDTNSFERVVVPVEDFSDSSILSQGELSIEIPDDEFYVYGMNPAADTTLFNQEEVEILFESALKQNAKLSD